MPVLAAPGKRTEPDGRASEAGPGALQFVLGAPTAWLGTLPLGTPDADVGGAIVEAVSTEASGARAGVLEDARRVCRRALEVGAQAVVCVADDEQVRPFDLRRLVAPLGRPGSPADAVFAAPAAGSSDPRTPWVAYAFGPRAIGALASATAPADDVFSALQPHGLRSDLVMLGDAPPNGPAAPAWLRLANGAVARIAYRRPLLTIGLPSALAGAAGLVLFVYAWGWPAGAANTARILAGLGLVLLGALGVATALLLNGLVVALGMRSVDLRRPLR